MITYADVEKLLGISAAESSVLSLYLRVPADPTELRGLPARAGELLALAVRGASGPDAVVAVPDRDRQRVRGLLETHGRDWLGHTAAIFVCGKLGLSEVMTLPCEVPDRAMLATRPHVRPLLVALQRCPAYGVAIVDRGHAWVFKVTGERIETAAAREAAEHVRSPGFGGWYGLESYRIDERIMELSRRHFQDTAAMLGRALPPGGHELLVVGGHEDSIPQFLAVLPPDLRDRFAGSFIVDPHTMTPSRVRALASPIIADWVSAREQRLATQIRQEPPDRLTAVGLNPCLVAVNSGAVQLLMVPVGGLIPGYACQRCGALSSTGSGCTDGQAESRWVPDLLEEMATRTIDGGGQVEAVRDPPGDVAARLRFPLTHVEGR